MTGVFSDHSGMKIEINSTRKTGKFTNIWKLNNLMKKQWMKEEIKRETKQHL